MYSNKFYFMPKKLLYYKVEDSNLSLSVCEVNVSVCCKQEPRKKYHNTNKCIVVNEGSLSYLMA